MKMFKFVVPWLLLFCAPLLAEETGGSMEVYVDLGDVVAGNKVTPVEGVTSAGQPDEEALKVFADSGYVAVIDLRGDNENRGFDEAAVVESLGMKYISLPIDSPAAMSFANAEKLDALINSADGPVLVHCGSGNRVGALLALRKKLGGASDEEALEHGRDGGMTSAEPLIRQRLQESAGNAE
ncbi:MAG: sulfur transferase domain-containing protein [Woeseiaceae bacterium]|nr:sulfur transferase domain-containing protein [Woeseiaceae bacterium]